MFGKSEVHIKLFPFQQGVNRGKPKQTQQTILELILSHYELKKIERRVYHEKWNSGKISSKNTKIWDIIKIILIDNNVGKGRVAY